MNEQNDRPERQVNNVKMYVRGTAVYVNGSKVYPVNQATRQVAVSPQKAKSRKVDRR